MKNPLLIVWLVFLLWHCRSRNISSSTNTSNNVYFIPSLHNIHKENKNYSYDSLKAFIKRINPAIIAVEIRPEDINSDTTYLKKNYPLEMRQMRYWFPQTEVVGFDWLGEELSGKLIPEDYWKNISKVKNLQRELANDSAFQEKIKPCYIRSKEREGLLKSLSLKDLLGSKDAEIVSNQYDCFDKQVANSKYQALAEFYKERNEHILENLKSIISKNPDKKILIVTGDDHFALLKHRFTHH